MTVDRNDLAYWFPPIEAAGLPVPRTIVVRTDLELVDVLDGHPPDGWEALMAELINAGDTLGWPCFLRTGHGAGKHNWEDTCHVLTPGAMGHHVARLVEWSHCVDLMGLPTGTWAVRELLDTLTLFRCMAYGGFPVTREFRVFVRDDAVEHLQFYWPSDAVERGHPDLTNWRVLLAEASALTASEQLALERLALRAAYAAGGPRGHWSVDLLQDRHGTWFVTDMAEGDRSFRWDPEPSRMAQ